MDRIMEHLDSNRHAPKTPCQQTDIEKRGRGKTEQNRGERVEEREDEGVAGEVAADFGRPGRGGEGGAVEDGGLHADDEHAPEGELTDNFVHGTFGDEEFFEDVGEAVAGGTEQGEEVTLELIGARECIRAGQVIAAEQDAHAADAEQDAGVLRPVIPHFEEDERDGDNDDDGPEVDELGGEDGRVAVGEDNEVVAFDVEEGEDEKAPAILPNETGPAAKAVLVQGVGRVDDVEEDVVEERLEGGDRGARLAKERRERIGGRGTEGQDCRDGMLAVSIFMVRKERETYPAQAPVLARIASSSRKQTNAPCSSPRPPEPHCAVLPRTRALRVPHAHVHFQAHTHALHTKFLSAGRPQCRRSEQHTPTTR